LRRSELVGIRASVHYLAAPVVAYLAAGGAAVPLNALSSLPPLKRRGRGRDCRSSARAQIRPIHPKRLEAAWLGLCSSSRWAEFIRRVDGPDISTHTSPPPPPTPPTYPHRPHFYWCPPPLSTTTPAGTRGGSGTCLNCVGSPVIGLNCGKEGKRWR
jgi:hypothetical protein